MGKLIQYRDIYDPNLRKQAAGEFKKIADDYIKALKRVSSEAKKVRKDLPNMTNSGKGVKQLTSSLNSYALAQKKVADAGKKNAQAKAELLASYTKEEKALRRNQEILRRKKQDDREAAKLERDKVAIQTRAVKTIRDLEKRKTLR